MDPYESWAVAIVTCAFTALLYYGQYNIRNLLSSEPLIVPYVSLVWVIVVLTLTAVISTRQKDPVDGVFTSRAWFSAGWDTGLSIFKIRIDTAVKYQILLFYQIIRSVIGSASSNFYRTYYLVDVQSKRNVKTRKRMYLIMGSQLGANVFAFFSSLTDTFLLLSQADMTLVTLIITTISDSSSIFIVCESSIMLQDKIGPGVNTDALRAKTCVENGEFCDPAKAPKTGSRVTYRL